MLDIGVEFTMDDNIKKIIYLKCRIFQLSKIDLIIGRPSIKKYKLSRINSSHFKNDITEKSIASEKSITPLNPLKRKIDNKPSWVTGA